ncbi:hypothetical protein C8Q70DRAFT_1050014 [Cubamyces menziesii]|nr:hypothetical protein C8Q70DRAFT_1050014 [Cubamyces menziesii]
MPSPSHEDGEGSIPAPDVVARYVYDNRRQSPSLQSQMGLNGDREALANLTATTREVALDYLELGTRSYREQRPETIEAITNEVLRQHSEVKKYQDGWPVSRYIYIYLKNHHPKEYKKRARAKAVAGVNRSSIVRSRPGPGRHSVGYMSTGYTPSPPEVKSEDVGSRSRVDAGEGSSSVDQTTVQRRIAETPNNDAASGPNPHPDSESNFVPDPDSDPDADRANVVLQFLSGLRFPPRDAEQIMALFKKMGIETEDYLDLFAAMATRDAWLRELCNGGELTPIQERVLREGLDKKSKENA